MKKIFVLIMIAALIGVIALNVRNVFRFFRDAPRTNSQFENTAFGKAETDCVPDEIKTALNISYGASDLDIYYPEGEKCKNLPVMIYVHGGGWQKGDKSQQIKDKIPYFTSQGFVFVSVNYRLAPDFKYPIFNEDVAQAVAWVSQNISNYRGDPKKLSLVGHSAGGSIIASVAVDASYLDNVNVPRADLACAIALDSAAYDMTESSTDTSDSTLRSLFGADIYGQAFGTDPEALKDASPQNHIVKGAYLPDFFIVTRGSEDRIALVTKFSNLLTQAGAYSQLVLAKGLSHKGVNDAVGKPGDTLITPSLTEFLSKCR